jgi:hypothetical protein
VSGCGLSPAPAVADPAPARSLRLQSQIALLRSDHLARAPQSSLHPSRKSVRATQTQQRMTPVHHARSDAASPLLSASGPGKLDEDSGYAHFDVKYLSLVFRPFKNEILLGKVHTITNVSAGGREKRGGRITSSWKEMIWHCC